MQRLKEKFLIIMAAMFAIGALPAVGSAGHLGQVQNASCQQIDILSPFACGSLASVSGGVCVDWDDLLVPNPAAKYSVDFLCMKDLGGGNMSVVDFDIGTGDRTDGGFINGSDLFVTFDELDAYASAKTGGAIPDLAGYTCYAKVKGLDPGKGKGRQNHQFSDPAVTCGVIP